jgi:hypothetical protein
MVSPCTNAELARWIEQAASHQRRAAVWLRRARNPSLGAVRLSQRHSMAMRAVEHLAAAREQLERARALADALELQVLLDRHLQQLDHVSETAASFSRRLHEQALGG